MSNVDEATGDADAWGPDMLSADTIADRFESTVAACYQLFVSRCFAVDPMAALALYDNVRLSGHYVMQLLHGGRTTLCALLILIRLQRPSFSQWNSGHKAVHLACYKASRTNMQVYQAFVNHWMKRLRRRNMQFLPDEAEQLLTHFNRIELVYRLIHNMRYSPPLLSKALVSKEYPRSRSWRWRLEGHSMPARRFWRPRGRSTLVVE